MNALIYIEINSQKYHVYEKEILSWAKVQWPALITYDLDNYSESMIVDYAVKLLQESSRCIIVFNITEDCELDSLVGFIRSLIKKRKEQNMNIIIKGSHTTLQKALIPLKTLTNTAEDINSIKDCISNFLTNQE